MRSETKDTFYYPDLRQAFGLVILLLMIGIPFFIIRKILVANNPQWNSLLLMLASLTEKTIVILIGLWMMRKRNNDKYKLKFKRISFPALIIFILMGISLIIIATAIKGLLPPMPSKLAEFFRRMYEPNIFTFIRVVAIAPVVEEIFFRGIILEGLLKNYKSAKAILWSAIIFGAVHLNPWQAIPATLLGLLIGWAYWKTNSLIPGLVLHCLNNLIATLYSFKLLLFKIPIAILLMIAIIVITAGYKFLNNKLTILVSLNEKKDGS